MLVWSFFQTMTTDPGQVPVFWGFHLGDNENKRRRYCLMCNVFKPERCHHCSACNRCVLNMDHHCPWVNNCVGFWNRKYFMLLLIYVLLNTYFIFGALVYDFYKAVKWGFDNKFIGSNDPNLSKNVLIMIAFVLDFMVAVLITGFLKFHIMLASDNKTTIENLDKLGRPFNSPYDIGGT
jgi:palmitoyltransferase ZDHHC2/15/20